MVDLKNVSVAYNKGTEVIRNISLCINDGDFAFIVGASGAGKSTLIKLLLKEVNALSGDVKVNGYDLTKLKKEKDSQVQKNHRSCFSGF